MLLVLDIVLLKFFCDLEFLLLLCVFVIRFMLGSPQLSCQKLILECLTSKTNYFSAKKKFSNINHMTLNKVHTYLSTCEGSL